METANAAFGPDEVTKAERLDRPHQWDSQQSAFAMAIWQLVSEYEVLLPMIERLESEAVEHFARQATMRWKAAHEAHLAMASTPDGDATQRVHSLLEGRTALLDLLACAKNRIDVPLMHRALDELCDRLSGTEVEPPAHAGQQIAVTLMPPALDELDDLHATGPGHTR